MFVKSSERSRLTRSLIFTTIFTHNSTSYSTPITLYLSTFLHLSIIHYYCHFFHHLMKWERIWEISRQLLVVERIIKKSKEEDLCFSLTVKVASMTLNHFSAKCSSEILPRRIYNNKTGWQSLYYLATSSSVSEWIVREEKWLPHAGGPWETECGPETGHPPVLSPLTGNKRGEWSGHLSLTAILTSLNHWQRRSMLNLNISSTT